METTSTSFPCSLGCTRPHVTFMVPSWSWPIPLLPAPVSWPSDEMTPRVVFIPLWGQNAWPNMACPSSHPLSASHSSNHSCLHLHSSISLTLGLQMYSSNFTFGQDPLCSTNWPVSAYRDNYVVPLPRGRPMGITWMAWWQPSIWFHCLATWKWTLFSAFYLI